MTDEVQLREKLWKALKSDMTVMLALSDIDEGHSQPMTAQLDDESERGGPLWFFTAKDTDLVGAMGERHRAVIHFASKGHELFAAVHGTLTPFNHRETIDRLWSKFVAAWFEGGKDDPKLRLLRFEPGNAQVWLNENSLFAGVKLLLGADPKQDYREKVAEVEMGGG